MTTTTEYAKGYEAATQAIEILAEQVDAATMYTLSVQNIIPIHATALRGDYEHGASAAWIDWQNARRQASRKARWAR